jgi:hypothetical protein
MVPSLSENKQEKRAEGGEWFYFGSTIHHHLALFRRCFSPRCSSGRLLSGGSPLSGSGANSLAAEKEKAFF